MTDSIYGVWYTTVDKYLIAYSLLTDSEYKSTSAYMMLKEVAKEVYSQTNLDSNGGSLGDIESLASLNHCKEAVS
jgi:hypothetical protein